MLIGAIARNTRQPRFLEIVMAIYHGINEYPVPKDGTTVALGFFDGVHLGHRAVLRTCMAFGGKSSVALTFSDNPLKALTGQCPPYITDNEKKARRITDLGINDVIFEDFNNLRELSPEEFFRDILHKRLRAKRVCCGENYRFGKNGAGDSKMLKSLCDRYGIETDIIHLGKIELESNESCVISSTRIRELISNGDIRSANAMLGYNFSISGRIDSGNHIGTSMGFPTVNIPIPEGMVIPRYGVYASNIIIDGKSYRGATNIGVHPTVGENPAPICETFILGFEGGSLYGKKAECELLGFVRGERRFGSIEKLNAQIRKDCAAIEKMSILTDH